MEVFGYLASVLIGVTLGLIGGGGSILTIPILVYLFHLDAVTATAYSLFIVGSTSLAGIVQKYKSGFVDIKTGITFGLPSLISIFITRKWIVPSIPQTLITMDGIMITKRFFLLGLFAVLMVITSISMIRGRRDVDSQKKESNPFTLAMLGLATGVVTGLVGAGGGFLIIPALVFFAKLPMKTATGTSLLIIGVNSLIGFAGDALNFTIEWNFVLTITLLAVAGIFIGNWLTRYIKGSHLRRAFGLLTLLMGITILIRELLVQ